MKLKKIISRIFFPEICPVCKSIVPINKAFCHCLGSQEIKLGTDICLNCGNQTADCCCGTQNAVKLGHFTAPYSYEGLARMKLIYFKFRNEKELCGEFGAAMSERAAIIFAQTDFDAVTFVPIDKESEAKRGYNQSELLAGIVAEKLFVPLEDILVKEKKTENQHNLSARDRLVNLSGKITVNKTADIKGKTILLCDDIKTTGATFKECKDALIKNGAKDVYCLAAAMTPFVATVK